MTSKWLLPTKGKYIFGYILLIGFINALYITDISKQVLGIPKPFGSLWLITFILFVVSASQFLSNKKWIFLGITSVFLSQILISLAWQDAKLGTILNLIILLENWL